MELWEDGWEGRDGGEGGEARDGDQGLGIIGEYVVDVGLLKQLLEHEKQAAQELGQWKEDRGAQATVLIRGYVGVNVDEV